mmetsp:Transcript_53101/g.125442  ORF Transcript_53101/g.125442 Transcript_53101/m.125442 type:complete len:153 (-) Transcript_53101:207-665(-)
MPIKCCKCSRQCEGKEGKNEEYIFFKGDYSKGGAGGYRHGSGLSFYYCCKCALVDGWREFATLACPRCSGKPPTVSEAAGGTEAEVLENAKREAEKIKLQAQEEASRMLAEARLERDAILNSAATEKAQILEQARQEAGTILEKANAQAAQS